MKENNNAPLTHEELVQEAIALIQRMNERQIKEALEKALKNNK